MELHQEGIKVFVNFTPQLVLSFYKIPW